MFLNFLGPNSFHQLEGEGLLVLRGSCFALPRKLTVLRGRVLMQPRKCVQSTYLSDTRWRLKGLRALSTDLGVVAGSAACAHELAPAGGELVSTLTAKILTLHPERSA